MKIIVQIIDGVNDLMKYMPSNVLAETFMHIDTLKQVHRRSSSSSPYDFLNLVRRDPFTSVQFSYQVEKF